MMRSRRRSPARTKRAHRRVRAAAGAMLALLVAIAPLGAGRASEGRPADFVLGRADASARALRVSLEASGLGLGVTTAASAADYRNLVARSESRALDSPLGLLLGGSDEEGADSEACPSGPVSQLLGEVTGLIGLLSSFAPGDDDEEAGGSDLPLPEPLRADSRDDDAGIPLEASVFGAPPGSPLFGAFGTQKVFASDHPRSEANTTTGEIGIDSVVHLGAAQTEARTAILDGGIREAVAVANLASVGLGPDSVVRLEGLRWEVVHRTGAVEAIEGTFSIGALNIAGTPVPVPDGTELEAIIEPINVALGPVGLQIDMPRFEYDAVTNIARVTPLDISLRESQLGNALLGPVLEELGPLREQLVDALLEFDCGLGIYILVLDVALGTLTGAGGVSLQIGGVRAMTDGTEFENPFGTGGGLRPPTGGPVSVGEDAAVSGGGSAQPVSVPSGPPIQAVPVADATDTAAAAGNVLERFCVTVHPAGRPDCQRDAAALLGALAIIGILAAGVVDQRRLTRPTRWEIRR